MSRIPIVDYLVLDPEPHLVAQQCTACGARLFGRRNACAGCGSTGFRPVELSDEGEVVAFTIVSVAAPGVEVPFVAATIDCGGTTVQANLVGVDPDPGTVHLGQKVRLATYSLGHDDDGVEGIGFGFQPVDQNGGGHG